MNPIDAINILDKWPEMRDALLSAGILNPTAFRNAEMSQMYYSLKKEKGGKEAARIVMSRYKMKSETSFYRCIRPFKRVSQTG